MKIKRIYNDTILSLPQNEVISFLPNATKEELQVLIAVYAEPSFDVKSLCTELDMTENSFNKAVKALVKSGLISLDENDKYGSDEQEHNKETRIIQSNTLHSYSAEEIADVIDANKGYKDFIHSCEEVLGKLFNTTETSIIISLVNDLNLPEDYVLLLCQYAVERRRKSIRYIEKIALEFYDKGIITSDALDEEIRNVEQRDSFNNYVKATFFGGNKREFTENEKSHVELWLTKYKFSKDVIKYAYDLTIQNTNQASINYANAILENWYNKGIKTVDEAKADNIKEKEKKQPVASKTKSSFSSSSSFFEAALKRTEKSKKQGG